MHPQDPTYVKINRYCLDSTGANTCRQSLFVDDFSTVDNNGCAECQETESRILAEGYTQTYFDTLPTDKKIKEKMIPYFNCEVLTTPINNCLYYS